MQYTHGTRQTLLELLNQGAEPAKSSARDELTFCWPDSQPQAGLPVAIFVKDTSLRDFLAWSTTYLNAYFPLTSLCRVLPASLEDTHRKLIPSAESRRLAGIIAATTIAETVTHAPVSWSGPIEHRHCLSTFAFAIGRALMLDTPSSVLERIPDRWLAARTVLGQRRTDVSPDLMIAFWSAFQAALGEGGGTRSAAGREALSEIVASKAITAKLLRRYLDVPETAATRMTRGSREDRVQVFETFVDEMRSAAISREARSFGVGLAAAAIAPGGLEHLALVRPLVPEFPTAVLWYSAFSTAAASTIEWGRYAAMGRRLERDLCAHLDMEDRPDCDIAVDELEVAAQVLAPRDVARLASAPPQLRVELVPGIWTMALVGPQTQASQHGTVGTATQMDMFAEASRSSSFDSPRSPPADTRTSIEDARVSEAIELLHRAERLLQGPAPSEGARGNRRRRGERDPRAHESDSKLLYAMVRTLSLSVESRDSRRVQCHCFVIFPGLVTPDEVSPTELRLVVPQTNDRLVCTLQLLGRPTGTPGEQLLTGTYAGVAEFASLREAAISAMRGVKSKDSAIYARLWVKKPVGQAMVASSRSRVRFLETEITTQIQGWDSIPDEAGDTHR